MISPFLSNQGENTMKRINGSSASERYTVNSAKMYTKNAIENRLAPVSGLTPRYSHEFLYKAFEGYVNTNPRGPIKDYCIRAFQPLLSILNDFEYTLKPLRAFKEALHDLNLFYRGSLNIGFGIVKLIAVPFQILFSPFSAIAGKKLYEGKARLENNDSPYGFWACWGQVLLSIGSDALYGINKILRGAIELVMSPICWIRVLCRAAITKYKGGYTDFSDNEQTQRLISAYEHCARDDADQTTLEISPLNVTDNTRLQILCALMYEHDKWTRAGQKFQSTNNSSENITDLFKAAIMIQTQEIPNVLQLNIPVVYEELPSSINLAQARKFVEFFKKPKAIERDKSGDMSKDAANGDTESAPLLPA